MTTPSPNPAPPGPSQTTAAPPPWWASRRSWWELFLQFFAVLLGVVAATSVNTWREDRAAQATVGHALQSLANEVAINRNQLAARVTYYRQVVAEIDAALKAKGPEAGLADLPSMQGLNPPFLRRAAYEVSFHSGAFARLEHGLAERTAAVYAFQDWVLKLVDKTLSVIIRSSDQGLRLRDLRMAFSDWATMGTELRGHYDRLLSELPAPAAGALASTPASAPASGSATAAPG